MIDPPNDPPRTSDPAALGSEPPASVGTHRRRKPQPHHRPSSNVFAEPAELRIVVERREMDPAAWSQLVGLLVGLLDMPPPTREARR